MAKIDIKKSFKHLYQPSTRAVQQVEVPTFNYLMTDGAGDPNTSQVYAQAVEALFAVSYTLKFMVKKGLHEFIDAHSSLTGKHHEIYLSDIRRVDPQKWKTIIRQPMK